MDDTITTIYCLCDDFLKAFRLKDDPQTRLSTAEVVTIPLVASTFFAGNIDKTCRFLHEYGYTPKKISKSRLNCRIHAIEPALWRALFELLALALLLPALVPLYAGWFVGRSGRPAFDEPSDGAPLPKAPGRRSSSSATASGMSTRYIPPRAGR